MKSGVVLGCVALAVAGVASAHAQTQACGQLAQAFTYSQAQVKALAGTQVEKDDDSTEFTSKLQLAGFKDCTIDIATKKDTFGDYWQHNLSCDGEAASAEAATQVVEALWNCTKETYSERHAGEAWFDGRYRIINFAGEAPLAGRSAGLVDFGTTNYSRITVEKTYDTSEDYRLNVYWLFTR